MTISCLGRQNLSAVGRQHPGSQGDATLPDNIQIRHANEFDRDTDAPGNEGGIIEGFWRLRCRPYRTLQSRFRYAISFLIPIELKGFPDSSDGLPGTMFVFYQSKPHIFITAFTEPDPRRNGYFCLFE